LTREGEKKMFRSLNRLLGTSLRILLVCAATVSCASVAMSQAQSDAADLQGTVRDMNGAVVPNAAVSVRNTATNVTREGRQTKTAFTRSSI
jgi:hypothetical protein